MVMALKCKRTKETSSGGTYADHFVKLIVMFVVLGKPTQIVQ